MEEPRSRRQEANHKVVPLSASRRRPGAARLARDGGGRVVDHLSRRVGRRWLGPPLHHPFRPWRWSKVSGGVSGGGCERYRRRKLQVKRAGWGGGGRWESATKRTMGDKERCAVRCAPRPILVLRPGPARPN
jgi:hypothetical protein